MGGGTESGSSNPRHFILKVLRNLKFLVSSVKNLKTGDFWADVTFKVLKRRDASPRLPPPPRCRRPWVRTCTRAMCSIRNTYRTHCCWSHNLTGNFGAIRSIILDIREMGAHVRTGRCNPSSTSVKRLYNGFLTTYQISA